MKNTGYKRFCLFSLLAVIALSAYPLYMGISVIVKTVQNGFVPYDEYPKYVIPYTPIAIALIIGVAMIPVFQKLGGKIVQFCGTAVSLGVFVLTEKLLETKILVQTQSLVSLESWQMSLCYVPPEQYETRTWEAVDVLLGGYSPAFKIHFYIISAVIIITLLNCFYGFAWMFRTGDKSRKKALIVQSVTGAAFLGMCVWACFTAFYRTGEITVSALSAILMAVFFALLGVTVGVFTGSFTIGKGKLLSKVLPTVAAVLVTTAMYVGEMILLSGNLYRFGTGFLFEGLGWLVLAPVDLAVIICSGIITLVICLALNRSYKPDYIEKLEAE